MISDVFPLDPPTDWFLDLPAWFEPGMKASLVTDGPEAGRFAGTVAMRGTFILAGGGEQWRSPDSPTQYKDSMQGDTVTADGRTVRTANLSADLNHVSPRASFAEAVDAMANTGVQLARVRYVDLPGYGTVALGAAWPGLSDLEVRKLQASALSGDWRWREEYGAYDMAGAIFVNNPGLPLPSRPVFAPVAMAASLALAHPPVLGSWQQDQETIVTITNPNESSGGTVIHVHTAAATTGAPATVSMTAAPEDVAAAPVEEPSAADINTRFEQLEARMAAVEAWLADDAMAAVDGELAQAAALPAPADEPVDA